MGSGLFTGRVELFEDRDGTSQVLKGLLLVAEIAVDVAEVA